MNSELTNRANGWLLCAALTAASVVGCDGSRGSKAGEFQSKSDLPRTPRNLTASQVKVCPDGHTTLKDVPIVYGLLTSDAKTKAALAAGDFSPGGCVVTPDSPTSRVVCTTCGFGYDRSSGDWHGFAEFQSPDKFKRPFSTLMASFPVPSTNQLVETPRFHQSFTTKRVTSEGVSYSTSEPFEEVAQRIDSWFKAQKLKPMRHSGTNLDAEPRLPRQTVRWREVNLQAEMSLSRDAQVSNVSVSRSFSELIP